MADPDLSSTANQLNAAPGVNNAWNKGGPNLLKPNSQSSIKPTTAAVSALSKQLGIKINNTNTSTETKLRTLQRLQKRREKKQDVNDKSLLDVVANSTKNQPKPENIQTNLSFKDKVLNKGISSSSIENEMLGKSVSNMESVSDDNQGKIQDYDKDKKSVSEGKSYASSLYNTSKNMQAQTDSKNVQKPSTNRFELGSAVKNPPVFKALEKNGDASSANQPKRFGRFAERLKQSSKHQSSDNSNTNNKNVDYQSNFNNRNANMGSYVHKEYSANKSKFPDSDKQRYSIEELLAINEKSEITKVYDPNLFDEKPEGLVLNQCIDVPLERRDFDLKSYYSEWYEEIQKERTKTRGPTPGGRFSSRFIPTGNNIAPPSKPHPSWMKQDNKNTETFGDYDEHGEHQPLQENSTKSLMSESNRSGYYDEKGREQLDTKSNDSRSKDGYSAIKKFNLEDMAEQADNFRKQMEKERAKYFTEQDKDAHATVKEDGHKPEKQTTQQHESQGDYDGLGLEDDMKNKILDEPLEEDVSQPPEEDVVSDSEAIYLQDDGPDEDFSENELRNKYNNEDQNSIENEFQTKNDLEHDLFGGNKTSDNDSSLFAKLEREWDEAGQSEPLDLRQPPTGILIDSFQHPEAGSRHHQELLMQKQIQLQQLQAQKQRAMQNQNLEILRERERELKEIKERQLLQRQLASLSPIDQERFLQDYNARKQKQRFLEEQKRAQLEQQQMQIRQAQLQGLPTQSDSANGNIQRMMMLRQKANESALSSSSFGRRSVNETIQTDPLYQGRTNPPLERPIMGQEIRIPQLMPGLWYYRDPQGNAQGPFESKQMREWTLEGFFEPQLLLARHHPTNMYMPLGQYFPDLSKAFLDTQQQPLAQAQQGNLSQKRTAGNMTRFGVPGLAREPLHGQNINASINMSQQLIGRPNLPQHTPGISQQQEQMRQLQALRLQQQQIQQRRQLQNISRQSSEQMFERGVAPHTSSNHLRQQQMPVVQQQKLQEIQAQAHRQQIMQQQLLQQKLKSGVNFNSIFGNDLEPDDDFAFSNRPGANNSGLFENLLSEKHSSGTNALEHSYNLMPENQRDADRASGVNKMPSNAEDMRFLGDAAGLTPEIIKSDQPETNKNLINQTTDYDNQLLEENSLNGNTGPIEAENAKHVPAIEEKSSSSTAEFYSQLTNNLKRMLNLNMQANGKEEVTQGEEVLENTTSEKTQDKILKPKENPWGKPKEISNKGLSLQQIQEEQLEATKKDRVKMKTDSSTIALDEGNQGVGLTLQPSRVWANLAARNSVSNNPYTPTSAGTEEKVQKMVSPDKRDATIEISHPKAANHPTNPKEELLEWCRMELEKIKKADNNSKSFTIQDAMSLMQVCASFENVPDSEIRGYFRDNLGSSAVVSAFATDFIKKRSILRGSSISEKKRQDEGNKFVTVTHKKGPKRSSVSSKISKVSSKK